MLRIPFVGGLFCAFLLCCPLHVHGDETASGPSSETGPRQLLVIHELVQIPKIVYVGDRLTLLVDCEVPADLPSNPSGADLLVPDDRLSPWTFDGVEIAREGDRLRLALSLRAWEPGFLELPDLQLAGAFLRGLGIEVSSVIDATGGDRNPAGARGGLLPPGTKLLVAILAGLVPVVLLALIIFKRLILPALRRVLRRRPRRRILGQLRRLLSNQSPLPPDERLARFVLLVRNWLSLLSGQSLDAATPRELSRLEQIDPELFAPALRLSHEALLAFHDRYRFSHRAEDRTSFARLLEESFAACEAAEVLLCNREREAGA